MFSSISLRSLLHASFQRKVVNDTKIIGCIRRFCSNNGEDEKTTTRQDNTFDKENYVPRRLLKRKKQFSRTANVDTLKDSHFKPSATDKESGKVKNMLDEMLSEHSEQEDLQNLEMFPSDITQKQDDQKQPIRPKIDPESTSITLFPGQGSQFVGMGKQLLHFPGAKDIYNQASEILRYDLLELCLHGPKSELDKTVYCQPAVFVTSIAAIEKLKEENFQGIESTVATAGFSVGEYAAMVFAEMMSFEDALKIVNVRAQAMQKASEVTPSGMMTVFTFWGTKLNLALQAAKEHCKTKHNIQEPVCGVANYLFPEVKVIAGHEEALQFIASHYKDFGIRNVKRVPVSGAFHTVLMESARIPVRNALKTIDIQQPKFPIYSNVTFKRMKKDKEFYKNITNQIVKPVRWEQILGKLYKRDKEAKFPQTYECGPGRQLGIFLEKMNKKAFENYKNIQV